MPREAVYQLRLHTAEKAKLIAEAEEQGISLAKLIRQRVGLDDPLQRGSGKTPQAVVADLSVARSSTAEQPPVKRQVAGSTPAAPVRASSKPKTPDSGDPGESPGTRPPIPEDALEARALTLRAQGYTRPVALRMARAEMEAEHQTGGAA